MKYHRKFKINLILSILFLIIMIVGICSYLSPTTFSNFNEVESAWSGEVATSFSGGNGTEENPYQISRGEEIAYLKTLIEGKDSYLYKDKYYVLTSDINMGNLILDPIGTKDNLFSGFLDGQGYTISNLKINQIVDIDNNFYIGLFTKLENATIENINFNNFNIEVAEENNLYSGIISGDLTNVKINNVSLRNSSIVVDIKNDKEKIYIGGLSAIGKKSNISNSYINVEINYENENSYVGSIFGSINSMEEFNNILVKSNVEKNYNGTEEFEDIFNEETIPNNFIDNLNKSIEGKDYYWINENSLYYLKRNDINLIEETVITKDVKESISLHESGIVDNIVYVNDLESDYNYYMGLNYTTNSSSTLPTMNNKNIYNDSNLVSVQITYSGKNAQNGNEIRGTVSTTELQDTYIYYKTYPINDNKTTEKTDDYIKIELIDNPFTNRPNEYGFNGWYTNYNGTKISIDNTIYVRYAEVPVSYTNGKPDDIVIDFTARWTKADVQYIESNSSTVLRNAIATFNRQSMQELETKTEEIIRTPIYGDIYDNDMTGYYLKQTIARWNLYPSNSYNENGESLSGFCMTNGGCTVYVMIENELYDDSNTYYELSNGNMVELDINSLPLPIIDYEITTNTVELFDDYDNMSTYFEKVTITRGNSYAGYYNESGTYQTSGTCSTNGGCTYYKLIQYYDGNGKENTYDSNKTYYYLVTRDTNIMVLTTNLSYSWGTYQNKPLTFTGAYAGKLYDVTWNVSDTYVLANADLVIDNIIINSQSTASELTPTTNTNNNSSKYFYGNWHNVKIGRGIKKRGNYVSFIAALGGTNTATGSSSNITKYRFMVESGYYSSLSLTGGARTVNTYINGEGIYGNDYDRVKKNNDNLDIYFCASGSWGNNVYQSGATSIAMHTRIKSGKFGSARPTTISNSNSNSYSYGVYVGGRNAGGNYAAREAIIEGGWIYNLIGGPISQSRNSNYNDSYIYVTGGKVDVIIGGAGRTTTYGNRIIQVTGGTINYSIFGGSNGVTSDSSGDQAGRLTGTPYIYVGGNAIIGNETYVNNNSTLFGFEAGSIFGVGNGTSAADTIGSANNSYIIIDGNASVLRNVYGGGNYGAVGSNSSSTTAATQINIIGGTINGSVFGGGNRSGSGSSTTTSTITINQTGGLVKGSIYGGSNEKGIVYGSVNINDLGGVIENDIYGGGYGGLSSTSTGTYVRDKITIKIGDTTDNITPTINGYVYGGSAFGTVNGTSNTTTVSSNGIDITVNEGLIKNAVFGGAKGNTTYTPYVLGNITIKINGGNISDVFGGNNAAGTPNGTITIYLNGGTVGRTFGGGNKASVKSNTIYLQGCNSTNIFGGSNEAGTVTTSNIIVTSGTTDTIYGGNNTAGNTVTSNITINGGTISTAVYGGGKLATTTTTNVTLNSSQIPNVYGGGENANVTSSTNIILNKSSVTNIFGGSNAGGTVNASNITINAGSATNVFGGNNEDGTTTTTNIDMNNGNISNIYGGGNKVGVDTANINLAGGTIENVYGGANESGDVLTTNIKTNNLDSTTKLIVGNLYGGNNLGGSTTTPNINLSKGTYENIYGGGNQAITNGDSSVYVTDINVTESIYGGGNQANILGNTNVNISGNTIVGKHVFGGGNHGSVGTSSTNDVTSVVNIAGAKIGGNVYGGCNTSVVYGTTKVNIGKSAIEDSTNMTSDNINIKGTVFGGGEANESGSEDYDFSFISVTKGIDILIDGTGYETNNLEFVMSGSIFGSGNASSSSGTSTIYIRKLGTRENPNTSISIQRADLVTIDNSAIELVGTTDRTNEYSSIKYSLNRITKLKIKNSATLLLRENANMLQSFYSLVDIDGEEVKSEVIIDDESKTVTRNVDNRLYMLAGKNLNVTTNETATSYGVVSGMTFLGMYQRYSSGSYVYGMYSDGMSYGSSATAGDVITGGSYVLGLHSINHDITVDGYYTNYIDDEYTVLTTAYVNPTPPDSNYYMWTIGTASINYSFNLTASKYSSLGTYELSMKDFSKGNTIFNVIGFNADGLAEGVSIKDANEVPKLASSVEEANNTIGLSMKTETNEWTIHNTTKFYKNPESKYEGNKTYSTDNQTVAPSLMFYLYHAKNISADQELGTVVITLQALEPKNEIEYEPQLVTITITIDTKYYDDADAYDASITYGKKYEMPSSTNVNITNKSQFTTYFALFAESEGDFYGKNNDYYHTLVSNYVLPVGTKITMIDYGAGETNPSYYYYTVDATNYATKQNQFTTDHEVTYKLSDFIKMDSIDGNNTYSDALNNGIYYHDSVNYIMEEFIFIFDFKDTEGIGEKANNTILFELRNTEDRTIISVLGIRQNLMQYNFYESSNVVLNESITMDTNYLYYDTSKDITYNTSIGYNETELREAIIDTNYESSSMGINVTMYDKTGTQVSSSLLSSTTITIDGTTYYVDSNGVFRIKLTDKVSNLTKNIKLNTGVSLPTGTYTMRIALFASDDGLHNSSDKEATIKDVEIVVVGNNNLIIADTEDESKLIIGETGLNMNDSKEEKFTITYSSVLENPNIRMTVYKRSTDTSTTNDYIEYNAKELFTNSYTYPQLPLEKQSNYEYLVSNNPQSTIELNYKLRDNLKSGTYKIVFRLYDGNQIIDEDYKYIIIRKNV